ncbi:Mov34/MPN/PAD-1 family protein [Acinetobacter schindleri]|nr:Mov34/MPN/PAD-1 family protein [Acinetobacter schindleri]
MRDDYLHISFHNLDLSISKSAYDLWLKYRQINQYDIEACGVLIGTKDSVSNHYWIESVTVPMPKDIRRRYSFIMKDPKHQQTVDRAYIDSNGTSVYLGTWHSHPQAVPVPSHIDYQDWQSCLKRNPDRNLFFIIIGLEQIRIVIHMNGKFIDRSLLITN